MSDVVSDDLIDRLRNGDAGPTVLPDGSGVMLDFDGHQVLSLSKTGVSLVQQILSGVHSVDALARGLEERFDVSFEQAREDTAAFLEQLTRSLRVSD